MRLTLTEEQTLIESSVLSFLAREYDFTLRHASLQAPHGCNPETWRQFAEMGWLALTLPEDAGGMGAGVLESGLLMRAFGRHLVLEPFAASALRASPLLASHGRPDQRTEWLASLADGSRRAVLAHEESARPLATDLRGTTARRDGSFWQLNGRKQLVQGGAGADLLLVTCSLPAGAGHRVFMLPPDAPGLTLRPTRTADGSHAIDLVLDDVRLAEADMLGEDVDATAAIGRACAQHLVALAWEASGAMQALQEQTAAYVLQRNQFGQPLAKFQVVAHRLAEMAVCCEEAVAACQLAALRIDAGVSDPMELAGMVKSKVGRESRYVAQQAVQLHGAMGITEELPVASYFRKLTAFAQQGGSTTANSRQFGNAMLQTAGWASSRTLIASPRLPQDVPA